MKRKPCFLMTLLTEQCRSGHVGQTLGGRGRNAGVHGGTPGRGHDPRADPQAHTGAATLCIPLILNLFVW